jgi:hypothetical protein
MAERWICSSCFTARHFCDVFNVDLTRVCACWECAAVDGRFDPEPHDVGSE